MSIEKDFRTFGAAWAFVGYAFVQQHAVCKRASAVLYGETGQHSSRQWVLSRGSLSTPSENKKGPVSHFGGIEARHRAGPGMCL